MGDNLIAIDWGTNFVAEEIICMGFTTCALSSGGIVYFVRTLFVIVSYHRLLCAKGIIKCVGQILGTQNVIGRDVSELGDAIVPVMLGDNFEVIWIGNQNQGACGMMHSLSSFYLLRFHFVCAHVVRHSIIGCEGAEMLSDSFFP